MRRPRRAAVDAAVHTCPSLPAQPVEPLPVPDDGAEPGDEASGARVSARRRSLRKSSGRASAPAQPKEPAEEEPTAAAVDDDFSAADTEVKPPARALRKRSSNATVAAEPVAVGAATGIDWAHDTPRSRKAKLERWLDDQRQARDADAAVAVALDDAPSAADPAAEGVPEDDDGEGKVDAARSPQRYKLVSAIVAVLVAVAAVLATVVDKETAALAATVAEGIVASAVRAGQALVLRAVAVWDAAAATTVATPPP